MESYEINKYTCALVKVEDNLTKVIEDENDYYINQTTFEIMDKSCQYYGSSCEGRLKGTRMILGSNYKVPIVVEETNNIIFFPIESPTRADCTWISLNRIKEYEKCEGLTKVTFINGKSIIINISYGCFETQVFRANRLESLINKRKE